MEHLLQAISPEMVSSLRLDLLVKLGLSVLLGGAVGLERELSGKPAGLRTNILICLGSTMLMDLSIKVGIGPDGIRYGDPGRIAAQVVTGIGFLGAGTILQARGAVVGLTTSATIWVVAAIGLAVGADRYVEAVGGTLLVLIVLAGLGQLERRILSRHRSVACTIRVRPGTEFASVDRELRSAGLRVATHTAYQHEDDVTFELRIMGPAKQFDIATTRLLDRPEVLSVQFE